MPNNDWVVQRRAGVAESSANNVIYIGRASFRMEPPPPLSRKLGATPAPQVELLDTDAGSGPAGGFDAGLDVLSTLLRVDDPGEGPISPRFPPKITNIATRPDGRSDRPAEAIRTCGDAAAIVELAALQPLDPARRPGDALQTVTRPSRLSLSAAPAGGRAGVLGGLLTAATASVLVDPHAHGGVARGWTGRYRGGDSPAPAPAPAPPAPSASPPRRCWPPPRSRRRPLRRSRPRGARMERPAPSVAPAASARPLVAAPPAKPRRRRARRAWQSVAPVRGRARAPTEPVGYAPGFGRGQAVLAARPQASRRSQDAPPQWPRTRGELGRPLR